MYENIHIGIQNLRKPDRIKPGGLCKIYFTPRRNIATWPTKNPLTGTITDTVTLKAGATLYIAEATQKERTFTESTNSNAAGDFTEMQVLTSLPGNTVNHILGLSAMMNDEFVLIISDINGEQRLIGTEDAGAKLSWKYTSGDVNTPRYRDLVWKFRHPMPAPVYQGGSIILDDENFIFASLVFVVRFRVGAPGSPMGEGDNIYTNPLLANGNFIIFSGGKAIHQMSDHSDERYAVKPYASSTIFINGGVYNEEVIEIYKF